jgi:hypothetical protein
MLRKVLIFSSLKMVKGLGGDGGGLGFSSLSFHIPIDIYRLSDLQSARAFYLLQITSHMNTKFLHWGPLKCDFFSFRNEPIKMSRFKKSLNLGSTPI